MHWGLISDRVVSNTGAAQRKSIYIVVSSAHAMKIEIPLGSSLDESNPGWKKSDFERVPLSSQIWKGVPA